MTKKYKLYEYAQELYFEGSMTQEQIANQLGISEKTFRRWKNEYKWADAKKEFVKTKTSFHEDLYKFARKLIETIESDMENNNSITPGRFYTVTKMLPLINIVKNYEDELIKEKAEKHRDKLSEEEIKDIRKNILGIEDEI